MAFARIVGVRVADCRVSCDFDIFLCFQLPCGSMYERSFMHVETVTHTACAAGDFIITGSKVSVASVSTLRVCLDLTN